MEEEQGESENRKYVEMAFVDGGVFREEFEAEAEEEEKEQHQAEERDKGLEGWGSWAGPGNTSTRNKKRTMTTQDDEEEAAGAKRPKRARVVIAPNELRPVVARKYTVSQVPYPFTSAEQYERSLLQPLGAEWNTAGGFRRNTLAETTVKAGLIIDPIEAGKSYGFRRSKPFQEDLPGPSASSSSTTKARRAKQHRAARVKL